MPLVRNILFARCLQVPTSLVVGLGKAAEVAQEEMASDLEHVKALEQRLRGGIMSALKGVVLNGPDNNAQRYPGNVNLSFAYVEGESLIMGLKDIAVSSGRFVHRFTRPHKASEGNAHKICFPAILRISKGADC